MPRKHPTNPNLLECLTCKGRGFQVLKGKTVDCKAKCKNGWIDKRTI